MNFFKKCKKAKLKLSTKYVFIGHNVLIYSIITCLPLCLR